MYKYEIHLGEDARRQLGHCSLCSRDGIPARQLIEHGMCSTCYVAVLQEVIRSITSEACTTVDGTISKEEQYLYIRECEEAVINKWHIKRERAESGWLPQVGK
jgi:hypothetical protein